jgi:zinc/manganese transport system substrate-binding protein
MRVRAVAGLLLLVAVVLGGCAAMPAGEARPLVVVSTNILGDVVTEVAGDQVEVRTLMKPDADPHSFAVSAQEAAQLRRADLVVSNGLGLEEGLQQHLDAASAAGVPTLVAGEQIDVLPYADEDAGGAPDPHFWTDPARMRAVVDALEARLARLDGVDAAILARTADDYRARLGQLDAQMTAAFAAIPVERRALVTNHHVFGYLADRFDIALIGAAIPGGTTLAAPSASDLADLVDAIERAGVRTIFAESSSPDRLVRALAREADVDVEVVTLFAESLTAADGGAPDYLTMMRVNTERITTGLAP